MLTLLYKFEQFGPVQVGKSRGTVPSNYLILIQVSSALNQKLADSFGESLEWSGVHYFSIYGHLWVNYQHATGRDR